MDTTVLIVGAGPTGLVLALWLTHMGISVRIIDKNAEAGKESRALGVQARTLELYQQIKLAKEIVENGIMANALNILKNGHETFSLPLKEMGKGFSPFPFILFFPQDEHEKILIEHLGQRGVNVERNTELTDFSQTKEGVKATLKTANGLEHIETTYLCGCDGARSTVRNLLNLQFPGGTYSQVFYVADVSATSKASSDDMQVCITENGFCLVLPVRSRGTFRLIGIVPQDKEAKSQITFEDVLPSIINNTLLSIKSLNWFSTYHVHHRVAKYFRQERVFLAGDAAHIHSPAGAQGMNTGIGDAINLAWKLGFVIKNRASPDLLDSYEIERIQFAHQLVSSTDKLFQIMTNKGLLGKFWRSTFVPYVLPLLFHFQFIKRFFFKTISQIKIQYRNSPLSKGQAGKIHAGDRLPWVQYETSDNFEPLQSLDWQIHIYGEADFMFQENIKKLNIALHVFPWNKQAEIAGLQKNTVYLIRPDGYISYITSEQNAKLVAEFLSYKIE